MKKIGFYGAGNMAEAIISGMLKSNDFQGKDILAFDVSKERSGYMESKYGVLLADSEKSLLSSSSYCFLAVKPQILSEIENKDSLKEYEGVLISILAGVELSRLIKAFPKARVVRAMPNAPALIAAGMTGITFGPGLDPREKKFVEEAFLMVGRTVVIEEKNMDALTGLSGSGPAYVFQFAEALADAGVYCGLSRKDSYLLAAQTLFGSAKMLLETEKHPGELKDMVTSPGGTTIEGLRALEENAFRNAVMEAVICGFEKSKLLK